MRKILGYGALAFCLALSPQSRVAAQADATNDFALDLRLVREEVSKDSRTDDYSLAVRGCEVDFRSVHWGFRNDRKESFRYAVSADQLRRIREFIRKHRLDRIVSERKSMGKIGVSVSLTLVIVIDGVKTKAEIGGMYNEWGRRNGNPSNIVNLEYYRRAEELLKMLIRKNVPK